MFANVLIRFSSGVWFPNYSIFKSVFEKLESVFLYSTFNFQHFSTNVSLPVSIFIIITKRIVYIINKMLQEHHHMSQNGMQRNARWDGFNMFLFAINMCFFMIRMGIQQMGPPPNHRSQPMLMSIQPTVPASHAGEIIF